MTQLATTVGQKADRAHRSSIYEFSIASIRWFHLPTLLSYYTDNIYQRRQVNSNTVESFIKQQQAKILFCFVCLDVFHKENPPV